jgi:hypothetical protein
MTEETFQPKTRVIANTCLMGKQKGKPRGKKSKEFEFDRIIGYEIPLSYPTWKS